MIGERQARAPFTPHVRRSRTLFSAPLLRRLAFFVLLAIFGFHLGRTETGHALRDRVQAFSDTFRLGPSVTVNAWIASPDYMGRPPLMIATPAGKRHAGTALIVPKGSVLTVHVTGDADDRAPVLDVDGRPEALTPDGQGHFEATRTITQGNRIALKQGWRTLGAWSVRVQDDTPPQVALVEPLRATPQKTIRLAVKAYDDNGVRSLTARILPALSAPDAPEIYSEEVLAVNLAGKTTQTFEVDWTGHPWAGSPVTIQLVATDTAGHQTMGEKVGFTLPERSFFNPLARALVDARRKLLDGASEATRNEVANTMAGLAQRGEMFHKDPVVMMALRSGAVRLVLDRTTRAPAEVSALLWQAAMRVESGRKAGLALSRLNESRRRLNEVLARAGADNEVRDALESLREALAATLEELGGNAPAPQASNAPDLSPRGLSLTTFLGE